MTGNWKVRSLKNQHPQYEIINPFPELLIGE